MFMLILRSTGLPQCFLYISHQFRFYPLLTLLSQNNVGRILLDGVVDADAWYSG